MMRLWMALVVAASCATSPCGEHCDRYVAECGGDRALCESSCNESDCLECWQYVADTCRPFDSAIACCGCGATWGGACGD